MADNRFDLKDTPFEDAGEEIITAAIMGMQEVAVNIMTESLEECPVLSGTLKRSARIQPVEQRGYRFLITMGYGYGDEVNNQGKTADEYAVPVHEILEKKHPPPTKAKFLEDPVVLHAQALGETMRSVIRLAQTNRVWERSSLGTFLPGLSHGRLRTLITHSKWIFPEDLAK